MHEHKCIAVVGWKNSGKTTLVSSLVRELTSRGLKISTLKHAHHRFDLDRPGTDSFHHRQAGAMEVVLVSSQRWVIQHELKDEKEPGLEPLLSRMSACDLVIVEGYKREAVAKIEIIGSESGNPPLWPSDSNVRAIACDEPIQNCPLPRFRRDAIGDIADFIIKNHGISP